MLSKTHTLQFQPFSSHVDISFWQELTRRKLDIYKLNEDAESRLICAGSGLVECRLPGMLKVVNTAEEFKRVDKRKLLEEASAPIWRLCSSEGGVDSSMTLNSFVLLIFADLKKNIFLYWFGFPALVSSTAFVCDSANSIDQTFDPVEIRSLEDGLSFLYRENEASEPFMPSTFILYPPTSETTSDRYKALCVAPLADYMKLNDQTKELTTFGYVDSCNLPTNPGWLARNLLLFLASRWQVKNATLLSYRDPLPFSTTARALGHSSSHQPRSSVIFKTNCPGNAVVKDEVPQVVGWELNARGKPGPRQMNLGIVMDPAKLAESSADLNLRLMRWRQLPLLDIQKLLSTKCLLLGSGTLGCSVARSLLAWGVRHITLVDNGRVSYSNPVRQSLFEFSDCIDGGKPKAVAAAAALKRIFPPVNAMGVEMSIPMPGHLVGVPEEQAFAADAEKLHNLIAEHDIIFLGTDSRESRWLPTVICSALGKLCINMALGFDTFVVMRHGILPETPRQDDLGCYFCNDVMAPENSLRDRTLDQMCTVSRPGLAPTAAALGVELAVALLHHPDGGSAPADDRKDMGERVHELGLIPHQIRGYLSHYSNVLVTGYSFAQCTGCSSVVRKTYLEQRTDFVKMVCNSSGLLEEITGLKKLKLDAEAADVEFQEFSDEE